MKQENKTKEQILAETVGSAYFNVVGQETKLVLEYDALAAMSSWEQQQTSLLRERVERLEEGLKKIIDLYPNNERDGRPVIALNDIRQTAIELLTNNKKKEV